MVTAIIIGSIGWLSNYLFGWPTFEHPWMVFFITVALFKEW